MFSRIICITFAMMALTYSVSCDGTFHTETVQSTQNSGPTFTYTSMVNNNGQSSSYSIFTGPDGKLYFRKVLEDGKIEEGLLDHSSPTINIPQVQQDVSLYFPQVPTAGEIFQQNQNLQMAINNQIHNYLKNFFI